MKSIQFILLCLLSYSSCFLVQAKTTYQEANSSIKSDLDIALNELSELRKTIATEKIPLLRDVSQLENDVRKKQANVNRLLRLRDNSDIGLNRLRDQVKALKDQNDYAASLLDEFVRTFETRIDFSEAQIYEEATREARLILDDSDASQADRFKNKLKSSQWRSIDWKI